MSDLTWANDDIDWLRRYFLTIADLQGPDAAADEMARRAALWPENATLRLAAAEAGLNAGRDASGWVQGSLQAFEYRLLGPMYRGEDRAQYATALFLDGQVDEARNQAERVLEKDPAHSTALTTLGLIAALEGDTEGAKEMMDRARVADVYDPAYAVTGSN